jgi:predicted DNA-binding transcriptional regulator YafY
MKILNQIKKEMDSEMKEFAIYSMIMKAIEHNKKLYVEYYNKNKDEYTGRMVIPVKLLLNEKNGPGFLTVDEMRGSEYDSKEYRHFKFSNIQKAVILDDMLTVER